MQDLSALNAAKFQEFLNSFDVILSDVDGVLWNVLDKIPGTQDAVKALQAHGKKVTYVSNNATKSIEKYVSELQKHGFDAKTDELFTPIPAILDYLKKKNFNKKIFCISTTPLKEALEKAGYEIVGREPFTTEVFSEFVTYSGTNCDDSIGAVIIETDFNLDYIHLQKAATYLANEDVLFLTGASDRVLPFKGESRLIGPGCFLDILREQTGRKDVSLAKPSTKFGEFIMNQLGITDSSRVLFIGDSIPADMGFAAQCEFRKLLVLSGVTGKGQLYQCDKTVRPDYYANSLRTILECLNKFNM